MSESQMRQWNIDYKNGHTNTHDEDEIVGLVTDNLVIKTYDKIIH